MKHPVITLGGTISLSTPVVTDAVVAGAAVALARQCRWNGHIRRTVAEHSLMVGYQASANVGGPTGPFVPRLMAFFFGLTHDLAEAISGDISTPVKRYLEDVVRQAGAPEAICKTLRSALEFPQIDEAVWAWAAGKTGKTLDFFRHHHIATLAYVQSADGMALKSDFLAFPEALRESAGWAPPHEPTEMAWRVGCKAIPNNAYDLPIEVDGPGTLWIATLSDLLDRIKDLPE
jgi:hypothetical protein